MNEPTPTDFLNEVASVRYCDTISSIDEFQVTPSDAPKFQFHCLHWFAARHEILVRKLVYHDESVLAELQKQGEKLQQTKGSSDAERGQSEDCAPVTNSDSLSESLNAPAPARHL